MINEDDLIKSKLNTYRPSFEASDWAAMEKLLDKKSDKKPIVIWWRYGLAVGISLLLSAGLVAYFANYSQDSTPSISSNIKNTSNTISTNQSNSSLPTDSKSATTSTLPINSKSATTSTFNLSTNNNNQQNNTVNSNNLIKSTTINSISNSTKQIANQHNDVHHANTNNIAAIANDRIYQNKVENTNLFNNGISTMAVREKQAMLEFNQLALTEISQSFIENTIKSTDGNFVNIRKRASSIPLEYSIALQGSGLLNLALKRNNINLYLDQLSDANLIGQVMIGNHIGLYTGIGYADRKSGANFDSTIYSDILYSNLTVVNDKNVGISIPVGITANIYKQAFVNVYARAGINNLVFLKEYTTVEYSSNPTTPIYTNNTNQFGNTLINSSADMLSPYSDYSLTSSNPLSNYNDEILRKTYKLKPTEKYLAELNLAIGIKAKMTKNLSFILEPAYRMGFKNKNRSETYHSLALSGAFVFSF